MNHPAPWRVGSDGFAVWIRDVEDCLVLSYESTQTHRDILHRIVKAVNAYERLGVDDEK